VSDDAAAAGGRDRLGGDNLPVVVGVIVGVASDLLTLRTDATIFVLQGVVLLVRVK